MTWQLDTAHTEASFAVRHMMISTVRGSFSDIEANVEINPSDLSSSRVTATIPTATVNTNEEQRDTHLRSADFFDAENHPHITFRSTQVQVEGTDVTILGDLTIRGTTHPVTLRGEFQGPSKDPWGQSRFGFSLSAEINREDFGLTWNQALEAGGVLVAKKVKLLLEVQVVDK